MPAQKDVGLSEEELERSKEEAKKKKLQRMLKASAHAACFWKKCNTIIANAKGVLSLA